MRTGTGLAAGLGVTELVSWGVLVYAFGVLVVPMHDELGWSFATLNTAYAGGMLVSGLVAVPAGWWLRRHGARGLMVGGSVLASAVLVAWSAVRTPAQFVLVSLFCGLAMAATLYEPAFAVIVERRGDPKDRARAIVIVTGIAGFASVVFVPLTGQLSTAHGWRSALLVLAVVTLLVGAPLHALLIRPVAHCAATPRATVREFRSSASFRWLSVCLSGSTAMKTGFGVSVVAYLVSRGYPLRHAALVGGAAGICQVGGRLLVSWLRLPTHLVCAAVFAGQSVAAVLLIFVADRRLGSVLLLVLATVLLGLGYGIVELLRGTLVVDYYGRTAYPTVNARLATRVVAARTAGPLLAGWVVTATGSYLPMLLGGSALAALSAVAMLLTHRARPRNLVSG
ncbi:MFS transporter [Pseudonocardia spinosispora]|uniref:MFS transporter n=1 Tax=Pseudonocardia spinosispora TaxID=103441 RepID=UPI000686D60C|nr:MFS transporter [Pseudonocardia spinosispora]